MLVGAGSHKTAIGQDEVEGQDIIAGKAELACQPADAAAEREASHTGRGDGSTD